VRVRPSDANLRPGCLFTLGDCPTLHLAVEVKVLNNTPTLHPTHRISVSGRSGDIFLFFSDRVEVICEAR
jgi:hypothetical protein